MPDQRDVQQLIQSLTPSAVNNGNPNTVYNQPMPQGGYIPPTFDPGTNTWRVNPAPPAPTVNWQQMAMSQPQSWNWAQPTPTPTPVPPNPGVPGPTTPVPTTPVPAPTPTTPQQGGSSPTQYGGGGGGAFGDGGGCVVVDSYLSDYDRADEVQVGDTMSVVDPVKRTTSTGKVSYSETKLMPCVRITTESGIVLECSTTAPIADELGNQVLAPALLNKLIPVVDNGVHYLDRVASIEDIGDREVRHITVENNFFLAGKERGRYLFHHNIKFDGNGVDLLGMMDSLNSQFGWGRDSGGFGAESMGGGMPNTRGAMQANGSWDTAHGGTAASPATQWGRDQLATASSGGSAWNGSLTGNESTNPFAGSQIDAMLGNTQSIGDSGWMTNPGAWSTFTNTSGGIPPSGGYDPYAGQQPYGTELYGPPELQVGQDASGKWGDWRNWVDLVIPGDAFQSGTGEWNGTNVALALADMAFGLPVSSGVNNMGLGNLMQGEQGWTADNARTNLQNQYQISSSEQRTQMVNALSERYNISAEQVRQYIGVQ